MFCFRAVLVALDGIEHVKATALNKVFNLPSETRTRLISTFRRCPSRILKGEGRKSGKKIKKKPKVIMKATEAAEVV